MKKQHLAVLTSHNSTLIRNSFQTFLLLWEAYAPSVINKEWFIQFHKKNFFGPPDWEVS